MGAGRGEGKENKRVGGSGGQRATGTQQPAGRLFSWEVPNLRSDWSHGNNQTQGLTLEI